MFSRIAGRYDLMNTLMTAGLDDSWRQDAVDAVDPPAAGAALDVGTGTGRLALALAERMPRGRVVGIDFAEPMLRHGIMALGARPGWTRVRLVLGDALALPFPDRSFDRVTTAFVVRNVPDACAAFAEIARVL
jgi:demethylmenaquinone methyltransferase/2-methoxy-6-polyprenyl-1,4-benzoquinol methylase